MKFLPRMAIVLFLSAWPLSYAAAQQLQCNPCSHDYAQVQTGTSKQPHWHSRRLGVSPSSLNFGNVTVNSSASLQLTLSASNGPVTISSAQVNSSEFTLPGLVLPKTIAAGQSVAATSWPERHLLKPTQEFRASTAA
jgi:hypothetical protein